MNRTWAACAAAATACLARCSEEATPQTWTIGTSTRKEHGLETMWTAKTRTNASRGGWNVLILDLVLLKPYDIFLELTNLSRIIQNLQPKALPSLRYPDWFLCRAGPGMSALMVSPVAVGCGIESVLLGTWKIQISIGKEQLPFPFFLLCRHCTSTQLPSSFGTKSQGLWALTMHRNKVQ